jgi:hypothetical protein
MAASTAKDQPMIEQERTDDRKRDTQRFPAFITDICDKESGARNSDRGWKDDSRNGLATNIATELEVDQPKEQDQKSDRGSRVFGTHCGGLAVERGDAGMGV